MVDPRETMRDLQREADRVCVLILSSDLPAIDIEIEKNKVRERCLELYPDREQALRDGLREPLPTTLGSVPV